MRDPELMVGLLEEMSGNDMGRLSVPIKSGMDKQDMHRRHHVELLVDAGHAEWLGDRTRVARITNAGYDFLNAATNAMTGKEAKTKFVDLFNSGVPYARAAQAAAELAAKLTGA